MRNAALFGASAYLQWDYLLAFQCREEPSLHNGRLPISTITIFAFYYIIVASMSLWLHTKMCVFETFIVRRCGQRHSDEDVARGSLLIGFEETAEVRLYNVVLLHAFFSPPVHSAL